MSAAPRQPADPVHGVPISAPTPCRNCGYDLQGLRTGERCPECGVPIKPRVGSLLHDNLTEAPMWYLRRLSIGLGIMCLAILGIVGAMLFARHLVATLNPRAGLMLTATSVVVHTVWWIGTIVVTCRRPHGEYTLPDAVLDSAKLRLVVRVVPSLFFVSTLMLFGAGMTTGVVGIGLLLAGAVASVLCFFGLVPLLVYLGSLADWAGDTGLGGRLRAVAWALAVFGLLAVLCYLLAQFQAWGPAGLFRIALVWLGALLVLANALLLFSVFQLALASFWAMRNNVTGMARDARIAERRAQRARADAERLGRLATATPVPMAPDPGARFNESIPIDPATDAGSPGIDDAPGPASGPRSRGPNVIEPGGAGETFGLVGDDG